ncbi:MAG: 30S ribosomal protein S5 [Candidatus Omnitrophota bacterium]|nr:30S ribosomal protein S5 [Candidatus Omnitrophota bacterium]
MVIEIRRVTKVTKGGKNLGFRAIVVVGDGQGKGGFGIGKANEVPEAIRKAVEQARKNMINIPLKDGTIPHDVESKFGPSRVILKPASKGHGMVAGRTVRAFLDVCGIKDITCKCLGSTNPINVLYATVKALNKIKVRSENNET